MKFSQIVTDVNASETAYQPYDRGQNGAFVWREATETLYAPRIVASVTIDDANVDKFKVQLNVPRTCPSDSNCEVLTQLGTDLVKLEMRFLASTSKQDRVDQIEQLIAVCNELRETIEDRTTIYS